MTKMHDFKMHISQYLESCSNSQPVGVIFDVLRPAVIKIIICIETIEAVFLET